MAEYQIGRARPWLNVRDRPGRNGQRIGRILPGQRVEVLEHIPNSEWLKINWHGTEAFAHGHWLVEEPAGALKFSCWPTESRRISQRFGANKKYYSRFKLPGHDGIDIAGPHGSAIYLPAEGTIFRIDEHKNYGLHVRAKHAGGYRTIFAHLSSATHTLKVGEKYPEGFEIGKMGNTGNVWPRPSEAKPHAGTHLHFGMKGPGSTWPYGFVDPWPFLHPVKEIDCDRNE